MEQEACTTATRFCKFFVIFIGLSTGGSFRATRLLLYPCSKNVVELVGSGKATLITTAEESVCVQQEAAPVLNCFLSSRPSAGVVVVVGGRRGGGGGVYHHTLPIYVRSIKDTNLSARDHQVASCPSSSPHPASHRSRLAVLVPMRKEVVVVQCTGWAGARQSPCSLCRGSSREKTQSNPQTRSRRQRVPVRRAGTCHVHFLCHA